MVPSDNGREDAKLNRVTDMTTASEPIRRLKFDGAVDADGHILEPGDLWDQYIESKYKARAVRVASTQHGSQYLEIDGRPSKIFGPGRLGGSSLLGQNPALMLTRWTLPNSPMGVKA